MRQSIMIGLVLIGLGCGGDGGGGDSGPGATGPLEPGLFEEGVLATYELEMAPADWEALVDDPEDNTWRSATLTWQGERIEQVGVRPSGHSSRIAGNRKPSIRLDFDHFVPGRSFHGSGSVKLDSFMDDPSMIRERLAYAAYRARGLPAPRLVHAKLFVNGDYIGLYGAEERVTRGFIKSRFGKPMHQFFRTTEAFNDFVWRGADPALYVPQMFEPRAEELPLEAETVRDFVAAIHQGSPPLAAALDVEAFLDLLAVEIVTGELDGYVGGPFPPNSRDFWMGDLYLYRHPATGRFVFIPWDRDQAYSRLYTSPILHSYELHFLTDQLVLRDAARRARFKQNIAELLDGVHRTEAVQARADEIVAQIREAALADPNKPTTNEFFLEAVAWTRTYIQLRNDFVREQLGTLP